MRKHLLAGLVGAALAAPATTLAVAQPVTQNAISGNECWSAGQGPGGPSQFLCINQVRGGAPTQVVTGSGAATTTATQANGVLLWHTPAPTTWAVTLPNPAYDGQIVQLATDVTLTTNVTVTTTNTPQAQVTLAPAYASQTITNGTAGPAWQFNLSLLQWNRVK